MRHGQRQAHKTPSAPGAGLNIAPQAINSAKNHDVCADADTGETGDLCLGQFFG